MKYIFIPVIALIVICSSFWGCQKEDLGNLDGIFSDTTQAGPVSQMSARINGIPWEASTYSISLVPGTPGQIVVSGQSDNGQTISLVVNNSKPGDYLLSRLSQTVAMYSPDSTGKTVYRSNDSLITGGVVNIDSMDTANLVMSGEFNFIAGAKGTKTLQTITDGNFINLGYVNSAANVQFAARVNGKSWSPMKVTTSVSAANVLTITALNADGSQMVLSFPDAIKATKTPYSLTPSGTYAASFYDKGYTLVPDPTSKYNVPKLACAMVVTSNLARNIKGTFSFYATSTSNTKGSRIASGQFNVNY